MSSWASHGITVTILTFLGLHVLPDDINNYRPTLYPENKRRIFAEVFTSDMLGWRSPGGHAYSGSGFARRRGHLISARKALDEAILECAAKHVDLEGWSMKGTWGDRRGADTPCVSRARDVRIAIFGIKSLR